MAWASGPTMATASRQERRTFSSPFFLVIFLSILSCLAESTCAKEVRFEIDVTWATTSPDGNSRESVLINGQFPGPLLELNYGDDVVFVMHNKLPFNSSIHFHGIEQKFTPWSDGVPGLTQRAVPPGGSYTYRWKATQYGSYMYHGHDNGLVSDGLYGPIYIHPPKDQPSPFDKISSKSADVKAMKKAEKHSKNVIVGDWSSFTSGEYLEAEKKSNIDAYCVESLLINGKGAVKCETAEYLDSVMLPPMKMLLDGKPVTDRGCAPPVEEFQGDYEIHPELLPPNLFNGCKNTKGKMEVIEVDGPQKWLSVNFISVASITALGISIDEHPMWVYAVDGNYIEPQPAQILPVLNGERFSVMIKLNQPGKGKDYTMRVSSVGPNQLISGYAKFSYKKGKHDYKSKPYMTYAGAPVSEDVQVLDVSKLYPFPPSSPSTTVDVTHIMNLGRAGAPYIWAMNNSHPLHPDFATNKPILYDRYTPEANNPDITHKTLNNTWVDLILHLPPTARDPLQPVHPIHKHSNKGYRIGAGSGAWVWDTVEEAMADLPAGTFNLVNPPYRDMFDTPPMFGEESWLVIRYFSGNPGPWLLHCHIQTHLQGGMAIVTEDGWDAWPTIPEEYALGRNGERDGNYPS